VTDVGTRSVSDRMLPRQQNDELYRTLAGLLIPNSSYHRWHQCLIEVHCSTLQAEAC
jgi:hypothetical protein